VSSSSSLGERSLLRADSEGGSAMATNVGRNRKGPFHALSLESAV
jgi:hypothetical protein